MSEVLGCVICRDVWRVLAQAYCHSSKARKLRLKDELQFMKKGSRSVSDYGRQFESVCDQLAAIGCPAEETDKSHWFLRGLSSLFTSFSAASMVTAPMPPFHVLLSSAESFDLFQPLIFLTNLSEKWMTTLKIFCNW